MNKDGGEKQARSREIRWTGEKCRQISRGTRGTGEKSRQGVEENEGQGRKAGEESMNLRDGGEKQAKSQ
jgi:hypothetical protein